MDGSKVLIFKLLRQEQQQQQELEQQQQPQQPIASSFANYTYDIQLLTTVACASGMATSVCADPQHVLVGTSFGYLLVLNQATGEQIQVISPDFMKPFVDMAASSVENGIVQMEYNRMMNLYVLLLQDGHVLFMTKV